MAVIRRARADDAESLTALAAESEAYWGYDSAYMERFRAVYRVTAGFIEDNPLYVLLEDNQVKGFYGLRLWPGEPFLEYLYIEIGSIGKGYGTILWNHMVNKCRDLGIGELVIIAAPEVEGFYRKMGAFPAGEVESLIGKGRKVLRLIYTLEG